MHTKISNMTNFFNRLELEIFQAIFCVEICRNFEFIVPKSHLKCFIEHRRNAPEGNPLRDKT